jgi:flagellar protein FliL
MFLHSLSFGERIAIPLLAMADETKGIPNPAAKKKSSLPLIVGVLVVLLGGGGGGWFYLHHGKAAEAAPVEKAPEFMVHLETFTVNLADPEQGHFLRITMDLGLDHAPKGAAEKGTGDFPVARARDSILSVLALGQADVLMTPEGKAQLKHDLIQSLQQNVPEGDVRNVYFTEFLVQR